MNKKKAPCQVCGKEFCMSKLFPLDLVRTNLLSYIKELHKHIEPGTYICLDDLSSLRSKYVKHMLEVEHGQLSQLDQEVLDSMKEKDLLTDNLNEKFQQGTTFGNRVSDKIAKFGGSWGFILSFLAVLITWMVYNTLVLAADAFDPYPYILLNLVLSCLAAIQAPIIMMSQNRMASRDRMRDDEEYTINLKTELEMRNLHAKMDVLMKNQWERLLEIQQMQLELSEELLSKKKR
ncbi:MAG: DUF1003 domain-containing protein [Simkaniaceae bacterium]|nr:DUF1003 domain-containing protein [Simkaniaceae bacterium]